MNTPPVDSVEGATAPRDFELLDDDEVPSGTMAGMTVELLLWLADGSGTPVSSTWSVSIVSAADWIVRVAFTSTLLRGDKLWRFKVTDGDAVEYFPNDGPGLWRVHKP